MYRAALALGTANQLTNILRDVGEDASQRNRIYIPLEELAAFKIREEEVCNTSMALGSVLQSCRPLMCCNTCSEPLIRLGRHFAASIRVT